MQAYGTTPGNVFDFNSWDLSNFGATLSVRHRTSYVSGKLSATHSTPVTFLVCILIGILLSYTGWSWIHSTNHRCPWPFTQFYLILSSTRRKVLHHQIRLKQNVNDWKMTIIISHLFCVCHLFSMGNYALCFYANGNNSLIL